MSCDLSVSHDATPISLAGWRRTLQRMQRVRDVALPCAAKGHGRAQKQWASRLPPALAACAAYDFRTPRNQKIIFAVCGHAMDPI
jgi:hypothetical protein